MSLDSLNKLFLDELKDLHCAENQLGKAGPKVARSASSPDLPSGFAQHREAIKHHLEPLEQIIGALWRQSNLGQIVGAIVRSPSKR